MFVTSGAISRSSTSTRTQLAAEAAVAAAAQGAFWQMHNVLLCHQGDLAALDLVRYAETLGLDVERFRDHLHRRACATRGRS
jgi:hypothetical protein